MNPEARDLLERFITYYFNPKVNSMRDWRKAIKAMLIERGFKDEIRKFKLKKDGEFGVISCRGGFTLLETYGRKI